MPHSTFCHIIPVATFNLLSYYTCCHIQPSCIQPFFSQSFIFLIRPPSWILPFTFQVLNDPLFLKGDLVTSTSDARLVIWNDTVYFEDAYKGFSPEVLANFRQKYEPGTEPLMLPYTSVNSLEKNLDVVLQVQVRDVTDTACIRDFDKLKLVWWFDFRVETFCCYCPIRCLKKYFSLQKWSILTWKKNNITSFYQG